MKKTRKALMAMAVICKKRELTEIKRALILQSEIMDRVYKIETGENFSLAKEINEYVRLPNSALKAREEKDFIFSKIRAIDQLTRGLSYPSGGFKSF